MVVLTVFFCNIKLLEYKSVREEDKQCCKNTTIIQENGYKVCRKCGIIEQYDIVNEYIDFHNNKYKIKKSIYFRK